VRRVGLGLLGGLALVLLGFPLGSYGRARSNDTWSGTWARVEIAGNLILTQTGSTVAGHYTWNDGSGTVSGTVSGATFTGGFNETHYQGSFVLTLSGKTFSGSYTGKNKDTGGDISGSFNGNCIAGACLKNGATPTPPTTTQTGPTSSVTVVAAVVHEDVLVRHGNGAWDDLNPGTKLQAGDEIHTGLGSNIELKFSDGTSVTMNELTQLKINTLLSKTDRIKMELLLRIGDLKAKVKPQTTVRTDFSIRWPSASATVRGTIFSVFYDPVAGAGLVSTERGSVEVDPTRAGLASVLVSAGHEVEVTATSVSPIAPLGKAGARGGTNRVNARDLALKVVARFKRPCKLTTPRLGAFSVKPSGAGWLVSIRVGGKVSGWSTWRVAGTKVKPANTLAKKIAAGCR
jgi:hypothetical protein